jgi:hypothetical protein
MKLNKLNWILLALLLTFLVAAIYLGSKANQDDFMPQWEEVTTSEDFNLRERINGIPKDSLLTQFPYDAYLESVDMADLSAISRDIQILDTVTGDHFVSLSIFMLAYTDSLLPRISKKLATFNGDSLSLFMMNVEGYKYYARMPGPNQELFGGLYHYWMSEISNRLDKYTNKDPDLKYNFKYRYLSAKCKENKYVVAPRVTESEKIVNNVADTKWDYLYKRIWSAPPMKRLFIFFLFTFTIITYLITFIQIFKKLKNKIK